MAASLWWQCCSEQLYYYVLGPWASSSVSVISDTSLYARPCKGWEVFEGSLMVLFSSYRAGEILATDRDLLGLLYSVLPSHAGPGVVK